MPHLGRLASCFQLMWLKNSIFPPVMPQWHLKFIFAKRLAPSPRKWNLWITVMLKEGDKKGVMKIKRQRGGVMIGLRLMEVWR